MKIVVIGGTSQPGSKVATILKRNSPWAITTPPDAGRDPVLRGCPSRRAGVTTDASSPAAAGQKCRGKACARYSSCSAIGRSFTDPGLYGTAEVSGIEAGCAPFRGITDP